MRLLLTALAVVFLAARAFADKADDAFWAVVEIPSHGLSGNVVHTEGSSAAHPRGWTLILTAAHAGRFHVPPVINAPSLKGAGKPIKASPRWIAWDREADLALAELQYGPWPYVVRIAPTGFEPTGSAWSCGYDGGTDYYRGQRPAKKVSAHVAGSDGNRFEVRPAPIPGRSGGGLIDRPSGYLIGICSTRELDGMGRPTGLRGWYVNLKTIQGFCDRAWPTPRSRQQPRRALQQLLQPCPGGH